MAIPSLGAVLANIFGDPVAIYTQGGKQLFKEARIVKIVVKPTKKAMEHPVETGAIITDHVIILPIEIDISMVLQAPDYKNVYAQMRRYFLNSQLLRIQTKSGIYRDMMIAGIPHEEDPAQFNALLVSMSLKQVQFVEAEFSVVPSNPTNSSTVNRGTQLATDPSTPRFTAAQSIFEGKPFT